MLQVGSEPVPGHRLVRKLGQGGFGVVWEAITASGQRVALKFLDCQSKPSSAVVNETRHLLGLRRLSHPHLIQILGVIASPKFLVVQMELADASLSDLHQRQVQKLGQGLSARKLCRWLSQAAEGLDFLARYRPPNEAGPRRGFQHCDVKPSNLLLVGDVLKVADFGLAGPRLAGVHRSRRRGTPRYAPPELREGRLTDRTDQFSLAVTYCDLRVAVLPPTVEDVAGSTMVSHLSVLSREERFVLAKAMDRNWINRWPSCSAFMEALTRVVDPPADGAAASVASSLRRE